MKLIIQISLFFIFIFSKGQNVKFKIDEVNFDFPKNKIIENACFNDSLHFIPFHDKKGNYILYAPLINDIFDYTEKEIESTVYKLEWERTPVIITITKYPNTKLTFKELIFNECLNVDSNKKYDLGIETINGEEVYWFRELLPDSEFGAYSTLFYVHNRKKNLIYLIDFSIFKKFNCTLNGLMIDIIRRIYWKDSCSNNSGNDSN